MKEREGASTNFQIRYASVMLAASASRNSGAFLKPAKIAS